MIGKNQGVSGKQNEGMIKYVSLSFGKLNYERKKKRILATSTRTAEESLILVLRLIPDT